MPLLTGKVAVVTGASRGIGRAIALRLGTEGAAVALCARGAELLEINASEIRKMGSSAIAVPLDLRDAAAGQALTDATVRGLGGIDIVVNCAGATKRGEFETLTEEDWMDGYALKMFGAVRLTRAAWPHLRERKGAVVNTPDPADVRPARSSP